MLPMLRTPSSMFVSGRTEQLCQAMSAFATGCFQETPGTVNEGLNSKQLWKQCRMGAFVVSVDMHTLL